MAKWLLCDDLRAVFAFEIISGSSMATSAGARRVATVAIVAAMWSRAFTSVGTSSTATPGALYAIRSIKM
jgi:hypothetical protein